ncbi:MAG TPA: DinB family protein [Acidimicrobiales bacterium]|nr:DinB family protein [Acidimicrobiales bacterium]
MPIDPCAECGFDPADLRPGDMATAVRSFGRRYRAPLTRGLPGEDLDAIVRASPGPGVWSALQYAEHVVDIFTVFDDRVRRALDGREPDEPVVDWEGKVAAAPDRDRIEVVDELTDRADDLGTMLAELNADEWNLRTLTGRGREVPVVDVAGIVVHEGSHHLLDIGRVLRAARGR